MLLLANRCWLVGWANLGVFLRPYHMPLSLRHNYCPSLSAALRSFTPSSTRTRVFYPYWIGRDVFVLSYSTQHRPSSTTVETDGQCWICGTGPLGTDAHWDWARFIHTFVRLMPRAILIIFKLSRLINQS